MALSAVTIDLAVSIVTGVFKLVRRVDDLAAENAASDRPMALVDYFSGQSLNARRVRDQVLEFNLATQPADGEDDPIPAEVRQSIAEILENQERSIDIGPAILREYAPERLASCYPVIEDLHPRFTLLDAQLSSERADIDVQRAIYFVGPGINEKKEELPWRIAMVLLDVASEFVVAEQERIFKEESRRRIVVTILTRFSDGDLEDTAAAPALLFRRVLSSTLNGFLDSRDSWDGDNPWLDAVLTALSDARDGSADKDDFLLGLVSGRGYRRLIKELAEEGATALRDDDKQNFKDVLADLIEHTGSVVAESDLGGREFLNEHWADIARAGLKSFTVHGPQILESKKPVLRQSLLSAADALARTDGRELLTADTVVAATEAVIAAAAAEVVDTAGSADWANTLIGSFAGVVADEGLRRTFSTDGLQKLVQSALGKVAESPEMLAGNSEFGKTVVAEILSGIAGSNVINAEALGAAVIEGALAAIAERPALIADGSYAEVVGVFARRVSELVKTHKLSGLQAEQILGAAAATIAANPELLAKAETTLADEIVAMVVDVAGGDSHRIFAGAALSGLVSSVLQILSRRGNMLMGDGSTAKLVERFRRVLSKALDHAGTQIGNLVGIPDAAVLVEKIVRDWSRGEVSEAMFQDDAFANLFSKLANDLDRGEPAPSLVG